MLVAGLLAVVALLVLPSKGTLIVTAAGPGNKALDAVQVLVDGEKRCDGSPCRIEELESGTHMVKVVAPGYQETADTAVKIESGEEAVLNLTLAASSGGTGIRVSAEGSGLKLFVDGQEIGPLPAEVKDLTPGEHTIKVAGSERYEPYEQKVSVAADEIQSIGPLKLKVIKGLATINAGDNADDAKVLLESGSERRPIPSLPIKIDIATDKEYTLVATRKGYAEFRQPITFSDGEAEKTFVVSLQAEEEEEPEEAPSRAVASSSRSSGSRSSVPAAIAAAAKPKPAATGGAKLNINSIPVSNVILDGRPLGSTPKIGVSVSPGSHTVVFVHPTHGRKVSSVNVPAGGTATAAVRFP